MCGIAGIIDEAIRRDGTYLPIREMTDIISYRGPDGFGYFQEDGIALGHRRLSIIDLSSLGYQPMEYMGRYVMTYNGEVYNYVELRKDLEEMGYAFRSQTDSEVILAAYDRWGHSCLDRFNGMFSIALYDRRERTLFCARDRFGIKPFYYAQIGKSFAIASEIKQFTRLGAWRANCNRPLASDFLAWGLQGHSAGTLFEGVYTLPGGHYLVYDLSTGRHRTVQWYDLSGKLGPASPVDPEAAKEQFCELLSDSIRLRLRSDVKVGSCLSGGLDSSSIVCLANRQLREVHAGDRQETVTSCFEDLRFDERTFADEVVRYTGSVNHRVFPSLDRLFEELDDMVWHQDEPFLSTSIYAQWNVFRKAREQGIVVMLDGQGADEVLGGYPTFFAPHLLSLLRRARLGQFLSEADGIRRNTPYSSSWIGKELAKHVIGRKGSDTLLDWFSSRGKVLGKGFAPSVPGVRLTHAGFKEMSLSQITSTNLPMLLHYEDRNSMAFSIESRVPFLDYRLVEFAASLPEDLLLHRGKSKFVLREAMRGRVPDKVLDRKDKMGFVTAEEKWLRENPRLFQLHLQEAVERSGGFVSPECLKVVHRMKEGKIPFSFVPWRIISFGAWLRKFNVQL